jgi:hypothetical protein
MITDPEVQKAFNEIRIYFIALPVSPVLKLSV